MDIGNLESSAEEEDTMFAARLSSMTVVLACLSAGIDGTAAEDKRPHVRIRGIYGGVPTELIEEGKTLEDYGLL